LVRKSPTRKSSDKGGQWINQGPDENIQQATIKEAKRSSSLFLLDGWLTAGRGTTWRPKSCGALILRDNDNLRKKARNLLLDNRATRRLYLGVAARR